MNSVRQIFGRLFKPHGLAMTLLVAAALAAGWVMLPGDAERIAMLELDGKNREALRILEARHAAGDRRHRTLFQLQALYEQFGDLPKARQMLEMLAEARPRDAQVQRQLATFYKMTQDGAGYNRQLRVQIAARYSEAACRELIALERLRGEFDAEQQAIELCRERGYRRTDDMLRLASLQASSGSLASATALLRSIDDLWRLKEPPDRLQLYAILLKLDQAREAQRRGLRWLRADYDESFGLNLIEMMAETSRVAEALDMARQASRPGDLISLAVGDLLLETGQELAARTYLKGWIEGSSLRDAEMAGHFISIALDAGDPQLAFEGAMSFGLDKIGQSELVTMAEALAVTRQAAAFEIVREAIEAETLRANPLLAAAAALQYGTSATPAASMLLKQVTVGELDAWRLTLWSQLMRQTGKQVAAAAEMQRLGIEPGPTSAQTDKVIRRTKRSRRVKSRGGAVAAAQQKAGIQRKVATKPSVPAKTGKTVKPAAQPNGSAVPKAAKYSGPFEFLFK